MRDRTPPPPPILVPPPPPREATNHHHQTEKVPLTHYLMFCLYLMPPLLLYFLDPYYMPSCQKWYITPRCPLSPSPLSPSFPHLPHYSIQVFNHSLHIHHGQYWVYHWGGFSFNINFIISTFMIPRFWVGHWLM